MLTVRLEIEVEPITLELYELEVMEPRDDFELEVARAMSAVRSGDVGDVGRARAFYRRFRMCRLCLRGLARKGQIPGLVKASW